MPIPDRFRAVLCGAMALAAARLGAQAPTDARLPAPAWLAAVGPTQDRYNYTSLKVDDKGNLQLAPGSAPHRYDLAARTEIDGTVVAWAGMSQLPGEDPSIVPYAAWGILTWRHNAPGLLRMEMVVAPGQMGGNLQPADTLGLVDGKPAPIQASAPPEGSALPDAGLKGLGFEQLLSRGAASAAGGDTDGALKAYFLAGLQDPSAWQPHLELGMALARTRQTEVAVHETGVAIARAKGKDRTAVVQSLDSGDIDPLRSLPSCSRLMASLGGIKDLAGTWTAPSAPIGTLPPWLPPGELAKNGASLGLRPDGTFRAVVKGYTVKGSYELRGTSLYWRGTQTIDPPAGIATGQAVGGILEARLAAPRVLELRRLVGFALQVDGYWLLDGRLAQ